MAKKRKREAAAEASSAPAAVAPPDPASEPALSKSQKRKLQKKRAKVNAHAKHEANQVVQAQRKAEKEAAKEAARAEAAAKAHPVPQPLNFAADEDDHCETAPEAYEHIAELLRLVAAKQGVAPEELRIYDPYFCNGAVVRHLTALGFPNVYNRNEDFYAVQVRARQHTLPEMYPHDHTHHRRLRALAHV